jgi:hypothetical protein
VEIKRILVLYVTHFALPLKKRTDLRTDRARSQCYGTTRRLAFSRSSSLARSQKVVERCGVKLATSGYTGELVLCCSP